MDTNNTGLVAMAKSLTIRASRWFVLSALLVLFGGIAWLAGDGLRVASQANIAKQNFYLSGVDFTLSEGFERGDPAQAGAGVRVLYKAGFFRKEIVEPEAVKRLKAALPQSISSLYFPDEWSLLWYLTFSGNTGALYTAIEVGLKSGVFANSNRCITSDNCNVADSTSTMSSDSENHVLPLILSEFIDPAIDYIKQGALATGKRRAMDALQLVRLIDFDRNISSPSFNRALVMSAFLTRPDVGQGTLDAAVLDEISMALKTGGGVFTQSADPDVVAYFQGMTLLRHQCALEASKAFEQRATLATHDPLRELFAFLAVRSLAMPMVVRSTLLADDTTLKVSDCGEKHPLEEYISSVARLTAPDHSPKVKEGGLASDILFYQGLMPTTPEAVELLRQQILREQGSVSKETPPPDPDDARVGTPLAEDNAQPPAPAPAAIDQPQGVGETSGPAREVEDTIIKWEDLPADHRLAIAQALASLGFLGTASGEASDEQLAKAISNFQVYFNYTVTGSPSTGLLTRLKENGALVR